VPTVQLVDCSSAKQADDSASDVQLQCSFRLPWHRHDVLMLKCSSRRWRYTDAVVR